MRTASVLLTQTPGGEPGQTCVRHTAAHSHRRLQQVVTGLGLLGCSEPDG